MSFFQELIEAFPESVKSQNWFKKWETRGIQQKIDEKLWAGFAFISERTVVIIHHRKYFFEGGTRRDGKLFFCFSKNHKIYFQFYTDQFDYTRYNEFHTAWPYIRFFEHFLKRAFSLIMRANLAEVFLLIFEGTA